MHLSTLDWWVVIAFFCIITRFVDMSSGLSIALPVLVTTAVYVASGLLSGNRPIRKEVLQLLGSLEGHNTDEQKTGKR